MLAEADFVAVLKAGRISFLGIEEMGCFIAVIFIRGMIRRRGRGLM